MDSGLLVGLAVQLGAGRGPCCATQEQTGCWPRHKLQLGLRFVSAYEDAGLGLLGDPSRRAIFERLARRPSSVQELADHLPISRPAVSQHLRVLREGGLVVSTAQGTRRIYQLNPAGVTALRSWLDGVWSEALTGFQKLADTDATPTAGLGPDEETS